MLLSIIIPTYNEEKHIGKLLSYLKGRSDLEVIVVDCGSTDRTLSIANGYDVAVLSAPKIGRAQQMNYAAQSANGDVFYFLHCDTLPPKNFLSHIKMALDSGADLGCFRFKFDSKNWLLKVNAFFTRFDKLWCRGGDQSLFMKRVVFEQIGGFDESFAIMEDYDIIIRARKRFKFQIMPDYVVVSARKYIDNSYWRVMYANFIAFRMFQRRVSTERIKRVYYRRLM